MLTAKELIDRYKMLSHPEGGYFLETYRSNEMISGKNLPSRFGGDRSFCTSIYFLLEGNQYSAFHRIKSDELWHFYTGSPLNIYVIYPDGRGVVLKLGDDISAGCSFQQLVPAGSWFASRLSEKDSFSFVGCTVAPGFDFADFELADKTSLLKEHPSWQEWINELCR